jgi:hypothetical protein
MLLAPGDAAWPGSGYGTEGTTHLFIRVVRLCIELVAMLGERGQAAQREKSERIDN